MDKDTLVISFGGSVVLSDKIDNRFFSRLKQFLQELSRHYKIFLIIGGGKTARTYIELGRKQGFTEIDLDQLGILSTRINATFLTMLLDYNQNSIPVSIDQAITSDDNIVIMGGTTPGHSTDYVGASLAYRTSAKFFFIATNVDGVYDRDPQIHSDAKHLSEVSIESLLKTYGNSWDAAGKNMVIDGPALQKIKDENIQTYVINGLHFQEIQNILDKKSFQGTKIII